MFRIRFLESDRKLNVDPLSSLDLLELDRKIISDSLPSPASPTILPNLESEDKQASELDDDKQLEENKQIIVEGNVFIFMYFCIIYPFHCNTDSSSLIS